MSLTDRQRAAILSTLATKGVRPLCPMCGKNSWELGSELVSTMALNPGGA
jgi:hypothetical protein